MGSKVRVVALVVLTAALAVMVWQAWPRSTSPDIVEPSSEPVDKRPGRPISVRSDLLNVRPHPVEQFLRVDPSTILVVFFAYPCNGLASLEVDQGSEVVEVSLRIGDTPETAGAPCALEPIAYAVDVPLTEPLEQREVVDMNGPARYQAPFAPDPVDTSDIDVPTTASTTPPSSTTSPSTTVSTTVQTTVPSQATDLPTDGTVNPGDIISPGQIIDPSAP